jgi:hypothetical protein
MKTMIRSFLLDGRKVLDIIIRERGLRLNLGVAVTNLLSDVSELHCQVCSRRQLRSTTCFLAVFEVEGYLERIVGHSGAYEYGKGSK